MTDREFELIEELRYVREVLVERTQESLLLQDAIIYAILMTTDSFIRDSLEDSLRELRAGKHYVSENDEMIQHLCDGE